MPQAELPIVGKTNIRQFTRFGLHAPAVIVHSSFVGSLKSSCLILGLLFIFFGIKVVYSAIYNKKNMVIYCKSLKKIIVLLASHQVVRTMTTT